MAAEGLMIGVDIGTAGCRALVVDDRGRVVGGARRPFQTRYPRPGWAEQDPNHVLEQTLDAIAGAVADWGGPGERVEGISLSSVYHSIMALDKSDRALTGLLVWLDTRSTEEAERLGREAPELYAVTGCPSNSSYPLAKLAWLRRNEPQVHGRAARFISVKDWVFHALTGLFWVDRSVACGSGLFDVRRLEWAKSALAAVGARPEQFSEARDTRDHAPLEIGVARRLGVRAGVPVVVGAGDGLLASVANGAVGPGRLAINVGTSAAARVFTEGPRLDPTGASRTWSYYLGEGLWATGISVNNAGTAYQWFVDLLFGESSPAGSQGGSSHDRVATALQSIEPAPDLPLVLPFLTAERGPFWNPFAQAALVGVRREHNRGHLVRAALEAVAFLVVQLTEIVQEVTVPIEDVRISGGLAQSGPWLQMVADLMGREVGVPDVDDATALGAALLGWVALGRISSLQEAAGQAMLRRQVSPQLPLHSLYRTRYERFQALRALLDEGWWNRERREDAN